VRVSIPLRQAPDRPGDQTILRAQPLAANPTPGPCGKPLAVSVVIPVYNEQDRIADALTAIWSYFTELGTDTEIIVADDGSTDNTTVIAAAYASSHPGIRVLSLKHGGKAKAVLAGLHAARHPIAGFMDVDLATPLATWEACQNALANGYDIAIASREGSGAERVGEPAYRHVMGRVFNGLVKLLILPGIDDTQCGFKFFTRHALDIILPRCQLYTEHDVSAGPRVTAFDVELLYIARKHGLRTAVVPITWHYGAKSKVNPVRDTIRNFRDVLAVRMNGWRGKYA
jgi:glycosyltransferase involved in cell wall biosynthesis